MGRSGGLAWAGRAAPGPTGSCRARECKAGRLLGTGCGDAGLRGGLRPCRFYCCWGQCRGRFCRAMSSCKIVAELMSQAPKAAFWAAKSPLCSFQSLLRTASIALRVGRVGRGAQLAAPQVQKGLPWSTGRARPTWTEPTHTARPGAGRSTAARRLQNLTVVRYAQTACSGKQWRYREW